MQLITKIRDSSRWGEPGATVPHLKGSVALTQGRGGQGRGVTAQGPVSSPVVIRNGKAASQQQSEARESMSFSRNKSRGRHPYNRAQTGTRWSWTMLKRNPHSEVWRSPRRAFLRPSRTIHALMPPTSVWKVNSTAPNNHVQEYSSFELRCTSQKWKMESAGL